jgi:hypothetical protein
MSVSRLSQSSAVHMLGAFLLMGGWAAFANSGHAMPAPLVAGLVQGGLSAAITLFLKRAIEALARRLDGLAALVVPPALAFVASASLLSAIHRLAGTPEILATIALPLAVATSYAALYALSLWQLARR